MDNFDRAQGVQVYYPPVNPIFVTKKTTIKKRRGSKWEVTVEDKLVKKTGKTRMVVSVTDGLAQREALANAGRTSLTMGTSSHLKGFTTGNILHDSYIVDSSRRYGIDPLLIYSQSTRNRRLNSTPLRTRERAD